MTRINVGIKPSLLCNQHLLAEHREIKRIPNQISKGKFTLKGIPTEFKLGSGHVKFFYDKLLYLKNRYEEIHFECLKRNLNISYYGNAWDNVPSYLMNDYRPTELDRQLLVERINERLISMNQKQFLL
jgi:deoxyribonuclease (pyrimidine dimer)